MILAERASGEQTLVGIMPALKAVLRLPEITSGSNIEIPVGNLNVHALFEAVSKELSPGTVSLEASINFPGQTSVSEAQINLTGSNRFQHLGMHFENVALTVPMLEGKQAFNVYVAWNYGNKEIGRVEMPVEIEMGTIA